MRCLPNKHLKALQMHLFFTDVKAVLQVVQHNYIGRIHYIHPSLDPRMPGDILEYRLLYKYENICMYLTLINRITSLISIKILWPQTAKPDNTIPSSFVIFRFNLQRVKVNISHMQSPLMSHSPTETTHIILFPLGRTRGTDESR